MKLLLLGGHGQAGTSLQALTRTRDIEVDAPTRAAVDVSDTGSVQALIGRVRPDWVVNFTAFHVLDACETDFAAAMAINAVAVREMALAASSVDAFFLTVSTDYVFDGMQPDPWHEDDEARPLQAYGVSKRAGELAALAAAPRHCVVVRTCGLYGRSGSKDRGDNFVERRLAEAQVKDLMEVGSDLVCTPTSAEAFATAALSLMMAPRVGAGIYHLTAEGSCSWAEFTAEAFRLAVVSCRVVPVDRQGSYGRVRRPANSVIHNSRARSLGITLPHWRDDLACYLQGRKLAAEVAQTRCTA
jgi:dTDP-4-dehydrorhamnose reductase